MRKKTYLAFKDLRAFYDSDTKKLRLTSGDPRLASQRWGLTLERDTHDKAVIERELAAVGLAPERDLSSHREARVLAGSPSVGNRIVLNAGGVEYGSLGPYLGRTSDGTDEGVFYSPLVDLHEHRAPLCLISGEPGSGKSYAAARLVDGLAQQGVTVAHLDPKGDLISYAAQWGEGHVQDLRNQPAGLLNPFELANETTRSEAVMGTLVMLLGGPESISPAQHNLLKLAIAGAASQSQPNLATVVHHLGEQGGEAQALFDNLRLLRELPFARLIFQSSEESKVALTPGLNLMVARGLDLPPSNMRPDVYSNGNRLALAICRLAYLHLRQALSELPQTTPKVLIADEAWTLLTTAQDAWALRQTLLTTSARQQATILIAQDAADFALLDMPATRMFFRQRRVADVRWLTQAGYAAEWQDEAQVRVLLSSLSNGECIMEDSSRNRATVQIGLGSQRLLDAFSGNPQVRTGRGLS